MEYKGLTIRENVPLKEYTTIRIGGSARFFTEVNTVEELKIALAFQKEKSLPLFVFGGGSNILVGDEGFGGLVIHPVFRGFLISDQGETALVHIAAGESWDDVVRQCVEARWWGIENMSFIPGTAGGTVIQNAGAYGQQISDVIKHVTVFDIKDQISKIKSAEECGFEYRKSIFNTTEKGRYIIFSFDILLSQRKVAETGYPDVKQYFKEKHIAGPTLAQMREAIISIRKNKGLDPEAYRSAGSFFKNPVLTPEAYATARRRVEDAFGAPAAARMDELKNKFSRGNEIKIPAGFLMDELLKLKGMRVSDAKLSEKQVISIINLGNATSHDVLELYQKVVALVKEKTGITLIHEPEFVEINLP